MGTYIYHKFLQDEHFMKKINRLHNNLNDLTLNLKTLLNIIGLEGIGKEEYREVLIDSVKEMIKSITKKETKTK